jgi:hypothetical protein
MSVMGTWQVRITRRDGSEHRYTEHKGRAPQPHEIIETMDNAGRTLRARDAGLAKHEKPSQQETRDKTADGWRAAFKHHVVSPSGHAIPGFEPECACRRRTPGAWASPVNRGKPKPQEADFWPQRSDRAVATLTR